jgi:hypothetical protein
MMPNEFPRRRIVALTAILVLVGAGLSGATLSLGAQQTGGGEIPNTTTAVTEQPAVVTSTNGSQPVSASLAVSDQTGNGTTLTIQNATATVEYYIDIHTNGTTLTKTANLSAGETFSGDLPLMPALNETTTVTVAVHEAGTGDELAAKNITYTVTGGDPTNTTSDPTYYQVDFVVGEPIENLRGPNGTYTNDQLIRFAHGSTEEPVIRRSEGEFITDEGLAARIESQNITVEDGMAMVTFTVANGSEPVELTLASYEKVGPGWSPETEAKQEFVDAQTATFGPGTHTLTTALPSEGNTTAGTQTVAENRDEGKLSVAGLSADADGIDTNNLNDEYIVYENTGDAPLDLSGWTVTDSSDTTYTFPDGFTLAPGEQVTLYTGSGTNTDAKLYWGRATEVWNDGADTMTVRNADGEVVLQRSYP